jgi:hypothetical protein
MHFNNYSSRYAHTLAKWCGLSMHACIQPFFYFVVAEGHEKLFTISTESPFLLLSSTMQGYHDHAMPAELNE